MTSGSCHEWSTLQTTPPILNTFPSLNPVFNVGDYRRKELQKFPGHDFFLAENRDGTNVRNKVALDALQVRKERGGAECRMVIGRRRIFNMKIIRDLYLGRLRRRYEQKT